MSNKKHTDAILRDYDGPFFPPSVDDLLEHLNQAGEWSGERAEQVAEALGGSAWASRPVTSDGYRWFLSLDFPAGSGSVVILIPWWNDWGKQDVPQSDRSIAVHTKDTDKATADTVVRQFIEALRQQ